MEQLLEILKYVIPSLVVLATAYLVINSLLKSDQKKMRMQYAAANLKDILPLKLQAYERLSVFLERISPSSFVPRVMQQPMSARDMHLLMIQTINTEFEHNLSQQVYVSREAWMAVRFAKDEMLKMVNLVGKSVDPEASNQVLGIKLLEFNMESSKGGSLLPSQQALNIIKSEVERIYRL